MNDSDLLRYSRHILLPQIDIDGQQAISNAHVMVIGAGGLGSPVILYLAAAGVGRLTLVDDDVVELSNLQRQIAHQTGAIGTAKSTSAAATVAGINPHTVVISVQQRADDAWLEAHTHDVTLIVDCSDNATVRYAINRVARHRGIPWVSGAAVGFSGQVAVFDPREAGSPCYSCLYPALTEQQLSCAENGILSPVVGVIGCTQATEALRLLTGFGRSQCGFLHTYDALTGEWRRWRLNPRPDCDCRQF